MRYYRKIIKIRADDSPNVRLALAQLAAGLPVTNEILVPGVLSYQELLKRRATWDNVRQCVGLDAEFYEGAENLLFPPEWLNRAEARARDLEGKLRIAKAIGCDPGEGMANSAWIVVDEYGVIYLESLKTPDTSRITAKSIELLRRFNVPPDRFCFDRGGGGKQHADRLRGSPHNLNVRTVAFGEAIVLEPKRGLRLLEERKEIAEEHYVYVNRRAQMYGELSLMLNPSLNPDSFGIPAHFGELRKQLAPIPRWEDNEGRLILPPKNKRGDQKDETENRKKTLVDIIGHSPDEADALVLAVHAMLHKAKRAKAGAFA